MDRPSHTSQALALTSSTDVIATNQVPSLTRPEDKSHWASWLSGPLSTIVSSAGGALARVTSMATPETKEMNMSLMEKLKACDSQLDTLHRQREEASASYDKAVLSTKAVEAKYENNMKFIQDKLNDLRIHMFQVMDGMAKRLEPLRGPRAKDDDIIETFHALMSMVEQLKTPAGTQFTQLFPHINMDGVKVCVDYSKAVALNKTILQEVAAKRDEEGPLRKRLEELKHEIKHVQREVDLIREFQMKHARIAADQVPVPMVDGAPKALVGDDLHIQERDAVAPSQSHPSLAAPAPLPTLPDCPFPPAPSQTYPTTSTPSTTRRQPFYG